MTDLERLWDDLPTSEPPVDAIIAAGRRRTARRQHRATRPLLAVGTVAALLATFVAGTQVAGDGPAGRTTDLSVVPVAFQADLDPAESCDELLDSYHERGLERISAWGWDGGWDAALLEAVEDVAAAPGVPQRAMAEQTASATGTNVQEADVDEPDTVKTDGTRVVRLRKGSLIVYDTSGTHVRTVSTTPLPNLEDGGEILLDDDVVLAIGTDRSSPRDDLSGQRRGSRVFTVSLDDPQHPVITSDVAYSSRVLSARQHGSVVRLVLSAGLPDLDFTAPARGGKTAREDALATNRRLLSTSTILDWLPTYDTGTGAVPLLDCTDIAIPPDELGLDTVSVVGIDTADPTEPHAIGLAGATTIAYESANHLYLAASASTWGCFDCGFTTQPSDRAPEATSRVFEFDLDGIRSAHVASGEIEGTIADRWSLDEADGVLRVAIGQSAQTDDSNSVVTLRRNGTDLAEIGRIDGLGPDEQIKSVRWFDDLAIVVTFREVDPLYTIDLTDPSSPRLIGELKIPGFSAYLHPLSGDELLGIGYDGQGANAQIAVFDVGDLADVRREDVVTYKDTEPLATYDPRAFTWLPDRDTVLTVVQKGRSISIASVHVSGGRLASTLTEVDRTYDATGVRTIALNDGRIIVVTTKDIKFFTIP